MAEKWNKVFLVDQGANFGRRITFKNKDLTGYTARMQLRRDPQVIGAADFELTTENNRLIISTDGNSPVVDSYVDIAIQTADTATITAGRYYADLELVLAGEVWRVFSCQFVVDRNVTR